MSIKKAWQGLRRLITTVSRAIREPCRLSLGHLWYKADSVGPEVHGRLTRYVKLRVAQAPGMAGTFSPPPQVSNPNMFNGTCVTHVP